MSKRAIELVRVSTEGQAAEDRAGIPAQREINQRTARAYGLEIIKTIEVVDVSGSTVLLSPEVQTLLHLMESSQIHGVVTKEFSRLIRPEKFTDYALLEHFIDTETILYLPDGPIDFASKTGRFMGTIRAAIAGLERREIVERMNDAKETMRRAGKHAASRVALPYGVGYSKERGWFYTAEVEKVKHAFIVFLSGQGGYSEIARRVNLPRANVQFILKNPIYTGWRVYDQKRDPSALGYIAKADGRQGNRRKIKRAADEVIRVRVLEALVSEDEFAQAQRMIELKRRRHWRGRTETQHRYTYNGFLVCGECRSPMYTHSSQQDFYQCKSRHSRERRQRATLGLTPCGNSYMLRKKLEPKIDRLLGRKLVNPDFLYGLVERYNKRLEETAPTPDTLVMSRKLEQLQGKKERVLEAFFEGIIDRAERDRRVQDVERELSVYKQLLLDSGGAEGQPALDLDLVSALIEPFVEWEFLGRDDRRALLAALCPEVSVYRYAIKGIRLNLAASSGDGNKDSHMRMAR